MMPKKEILIKHTTILSVYLLIIWGFYRFLFKLPEEVEELFIKPIIWLLPIIFLLRKERLGAQSIGITSKNLFSSVYLALALGIIFAIEGLIINFIKYGGIEFSANLGSLAFGSALGLSIATAISEEITFRGYLFNRVWYLVGNVWKANLLISFIWALIHIPVAVFWWKLNLAGTLGILLLITTFGIGSSFVFAKTKNISASILLHILWEWPIILFR